MKHWPLLLLLFTLTTCAPCHAGYALHVSDQLPEFVTVNGPDGPQIWPNSKANQIHPDRYCIPANYSVFAPEPARRTEVIRSATGRLTPAEVLEICPTVLAAKYQRLWEAASEWERRNISGVGLSVLSLGVAAGKPKALAVATWSNNLWMNHYYPRKAAINLDSDPDYDFSVVGDMPYSVPELSAEVWGQ